jgi:hypothetical protein
MAIGYASLYANGLNSNSQIRRSVDMIYQRGGNYEVVLTGDTYIGSMELVVDLYGDDVKVGRMALVPYEITSGATYTYKFNLRPYNYLSNFVKTEHYQYYWLNDWAATTQLINVENPYPNIIKANYKYGWVYMSGLTQITEYSGTTPTNDLNHFTEIPELCGDATFTPSGYTSTGNKFDYVGGTFQMDERFLLQNYDQEIGTIIGTGFTDTNVEITRRPSPMSTYMMDYPTVPQQSETSRFLSDAPRIQYIQNTENYVLYYLNGQSGDRQVIEADYAVYEFFNASNTKLKRYSQELNKTSTAYQSPTGYTDNLRPFKLPCGPVDIQNLFTITGLTWGDVEYYTVQLYSSYPTPWRDGLSVGPVCPISEIFYFYLYDNCRPENTRLAWLNDKGGYDYFTFVSYRQDKKKIKTTKYDNRYYSPTIPSPDRNVGRTTKTFDTEINQEIVIESDYLSVAQGQWIEQLFYSPQIYIMNDDFVSPIDRQNKIYKDLRPVEVLSTEVSTITKKHQKLNKYRITLSSSDNFFVNKGF